VLEPPIAKSVRFAEAPAAGRSILRTAGRTPGAAAYRTLARSLAGIDDPTPESTVALDDVPVIDLAAEVVPS
jgi:hypothetical protein